MKDNSMVSVRINGSEAPIRADGLPTIGDVIELIKGSIDPNHMITSILVDGRDLDDADWSTSPVQYGTSILEVETGTPKEFVHQRLGQAADVVRHCYIQFRDARKLFQAGQMVDGNRLLVNATKTLQAFFGWYGTLLELVPVDDRPAYQLGERIPKISEVCKTICQHQLYQSWWALGESLEKELEPQLDKLEDFCRKFAVEA